jgi:hypothetical protein
VKQKSEDGIRKRSEKRIGKRFDGSVGDTVEERP